MNLRGLNIMNTLRFRLNLLLGVIQISYSHVLRNQKQFKRRELKRELKYLLLLGFAMNRIIRSMKLGLEDLMFLIHLMVQAGLLTKIYHLFIDMGMALSDKGTFIHPGRFLFNAGKTPKEWNNKMLNNQHYKVVDYEADSTKIFPSVDVKGGIAITYWDNNAEFDIIGFFSPYKELKSIVNKVIQREDFLSFATLVYPRDLYKLTDELYNENEWAITRPSKGHKYDVGTNVFDTFPELFFDECPTDGADYIQIYGRKENTRCSKWIKRSYVKLPDNIDYYKVFIPKSNGSGAIGEVLSTPVVGQPVVGHTVTFLSIGKYETVYEAEATLKYIKSKFSRTLLGALKVTQDNPRETWKYVPMQDFTDNSDIDWTKSVHDIDLQLYKKYGLSDEEIAFIESKVKPMDGTSYYESMLKMSYQRPFHVLCKLKKLT